MITPDRARVILASCTVDAYADITLAEHREVMARWGRRGFGSYADVLRGIANAGDFEILIEEVDPSSGAADPDATVCTLAAYVQANGEDERVTSLLVGEAVMIGGGAAPLYRVTRGRRAGGA